MHSADDDDNRIVKLAAEIADARDRKIPVLLLKLEEILSSIDARSKEAVTTRQDIVNCDLLHVLILVLRQDFTVVEGAWSTAARLSKILSQVCAGLDVSNSSELKDELLPEAVENIFVLARRIQANYIQQTNDHAAEVICSKLFGNYGDIIDSLIYLFSAHVFLTHKVIQSPWLLQLLLCDDVDTVSVALSLIQKVFRTNGRIFSEVPVEVIQTIMDELIYKLSVNDDAAIGGSTISCVLALCGYHKPLVEFMSGRYKGIRPLLSKWTGKGFGRDLTELLALFQAGNSQRAELEKQHRAAATIQALWKGVSVRRRLQKANRAISRFHITYRQNKAETKKRHDDLKQTADLKQQVKLNRYRIMREFHKKQLDTIEILPASKISDYFENEQSRAALVIQKTWRGHTQRSLIGGKLEGCRRNRAATTIQKSVRRWMERRDRRRKEKLPDLKPAGLTDDRRVELQELIIEWRDNHPCASKSRDQQEAIHQKAGEALARYYTGLRAARRRDQHREALLARLETDSELIIYAPRLSDITEKDVEMYSSRSVPVATKAKLAHNSELRLLRQPWWRKLGDEFQDEELEEEDLLT